MNELCEAMGKHHVSVAVAEPVPIPRRSSSQMETAVGMPSLKIQKRPITCQWIDNVIANFFYANNNTGVIDQVKPIQLE